MPLRIAIISTPRTGSTWLRLLLTDAYASRDCPSHRPDDLDWAALPEECVRPIALAQNLRACPDACRRRVPRYFGGKTSAWTSSFPSCNSVCTTIPPCNGLTAKAATNGPSTAPCREARPFWNTPPGPRSAALMAVSREWASAPNACGCAMKNLVADVQRRTPAGGRSARRTYPPAHRRSRRGRDDSKAARPHRRRPSLLARAPGLWRSLLIQPAIERLAAVHQAYCAELGYSCGADPLLTAAQADANWLSLVWPRVAEKLRTYRSLNQKLDVARDEVRRLETEYAAASKHNEELASNNATLARHYEDLAKGCGELEIGYKRLVDHCSWVERSFHETQAVLDATREFFEAKRSAQERLRGLGPVSLAMARWLAGLSQRLPVAAAVAKRLIHRTEPDNCNAKKAG